MQSVRFGLAQLGSKYGRDLTTFSISRCIPIHMYGGCYSTAPEFVDSSRERSVATGAISRDFKEASLRSVQC